MIDTSKNETIDYKAAFLAQQVSIEELYKKVDQYEEKLKKQDSYIEQLKEAYILARRGMFGASSELLKSNIKQLGMFNESELIYETEPEILESTEESSKVKRTPKRRTLPDYLEREEVVIELSSPKGTCGHELLLRAGNSLTLSS